VPQGATLAVIGPNGSGKTVLFKALIGSVPYDGSVHWRPGTRIGYIPQKLDIERDLPLTGQDFLRAKATVAGAPAGDAARVIALVKLSRELVTRPIGTLSGGQFQRLLLAFALLGRPNVLLFDEPTAGVDEPAEEGLYDMIRRVQEEERLTLRDLVGRGTARGSLSRTMVPSRPSMTVWRISHGNRSAPRKKPAERRELLAP
jgi:zinc transport system ATP-binding protein